MNTKRTTATGKSILIVTQIVDKNDAILAFMIRWIEEFAKYFDRVEVVCLKEGAHDLPENVRVYSMGKEDGALRIKYTYRLYKYFFKLYVLGHVDYVFFHQNGIYNVLLAPLFWIRKIRKTTFVWWKAHGHINRLGRAALRFTDIVLTSTKSGFPIETKKRKIIGQAVDTEHFSFNGAARDTHALLYVGRINTFKKIHILLEVLKEFKEEKKNYTLTVVGPVVDEKYMTTLQAYCDTHNLNDRVTFAGSRIKSVLVQSYQNAHILLNPSITNSMDKTVLEGMLCGAIPVTSNPAFEELLSPYNLYDSRNTMEMYKYKIKEVTQMNDDEVALLRTHLRTSVVERHSLDTFLDRILTHI